MSASISRCGSIIIVTDLPVRVLSFSRLRWDYNIYREYGGIEYGGMEYGNMKYDSMEYIEYGSIGCMVA